MFWSLDLSRRFHGRLPEGPHHVGLILAILAVTIALLLYHELHAHDHRQGYRSRVQFRIDFGVANRKRRAEEGCTPGLASYDFLHSCYAVT